MIVSFVGYKTYINGRLCTFNAYMGGGNMKFYVKIGKNYAGKLYPCGGAYYKIGLHIMPSFEG